MCQSVCWPVTTLPLTYAEVPSRHTEGGWLSSATSLTPSVHPGVTWMPIGKHNQEESVGAVRVRRPFHSHCFPGTAFVSPAQSLLQDQAYSANSLAIPLPLLQAAPLPQNGARLILAVRSRKKGKSLNSSPSSAQASDSALHLLC